MSDPTTPDPAADTVEIPVTAPVEPTPPDPTTPDPAAAPEPVSVNKGGFH